MTVSIEHREGGKFDLFSFSFYSLIYVPVVRDFGLFFSIFRLIPSGLLNSSEFLGNFQVSSLLNLLYIMGLAAGPLGALEPIAQAIGPRLNLTGFLFSSSKKNKLMVIKKTWNQNLISLQCYF